MIIILILIWFISIMFLVHFYYKNKKRQPKTKMVKKNYYTSSTSVTSGFTLTDFKKVFKSPYLVQIVPSKNNEVFVRLRFRTNHFNFMSSGIYKNKKHAEEQAKKLSAFLKCDFEDLS